MTAPKYAMINPLAIYRMPRAELDELLADVRAHPPFDGYELAVDGQTRPINAQLSRLIRLAHETYWDHQAALAPPVAVPSRQVAKAARMAAAHPTLTRGGPARITATEANAVLAAMPEVPQI